MQLDGEGGQLASLEFGENTSLDSAKSQPLKRKLTFHVVSHHAIKMVPFFIPQNKAVRPMKT